METPKQIENMQEHILGLEEDIRDMSSKLSRYILVEKLTEATMKMSLDEIRYLISEAEDLILRDVD